MIEELKKKLLNPVDKQIQEKGEQKADFSKTFNNVNAASAIKQFNDSLAQPKQIVAPGTVRQCARQLELGPGSSFRNLTLNNRNEAAVGLLQSIGGARKGAGSTLTGSELQNQLQMHQEAQQFRRGSVAVLNHSSKDDLRKSTF